MELSTISDAIRRESERINERRRLSLESCDTHHRIFASLSNIVNSLALTLKPSERDQFYDDCQPMAEKALPLAKASWGK